MSLIAGFFVFAFGAAIGSFLNVCIYRLPREESIVRPASRCPHCLKAVAWYDNIPLVSFAMLGGKCRHCRKGIAWRYFWVELVNGLLWLFLWKMYGGSWFFAAGAILFSILLVVSVIDLETGLIPDKLSIPGIVTGLILSTIHPALQGKIVWTEGLLQSALGVLTGGGVLFLTGLLGNWIFKKESMGGGDVKLLAMLGAFLGVKDTVLTFLLAPFAAMPLALYIKFIRKVETIPYGPFLALAGACLFLFGEKIAAFFFGSF